MILFCGFEPFLDYSHNISESLAIALSESFLEAESVLFPVAFDGLKERLSDKKWSHNWIVAFGIASGRRALSLEVLATNVIHSKRPDNKGFLGHDRSIEDIKLLALRTQFPYQKLFDELKGDGIPVELSFSAGTYVCNALYWHILRCNPKKSIFIHLPVDKKGELLIPFVCLHRVLAEKLGQVLV